MKISELQKHVAEFSKTRGFDQNSVEMRMLYLTSEVGEVAEEVLRVVENHHLANKANLGMEMYDVIWNLLELANQLDIDMEKAAEQKIEINKDRVWE
ncbi:MAG TPA: MazG-like family protein [Bacillales bacterium]|nr:MazG-like family protein [Bacillales bacterium]